MYRLANQELYFDVDYDSDLHELVWPWADARYVRRIHLEISDPHGDGLMTLVTRYYPGYQETILGREGMIISDGYNGTPTGFPNDCEDGTGLTHWYVLHAEANAIMKVARSTNNAREATLYLTHSPCKDCSKLILQAGIGRLVFLDPYKDPAGLDLLKEGGLLVTQLQAL